MRLIYIVLLSVFLVPNFNHAQTEGSDGEGDSRVYQVADRTYLYVNRGGNICLYTGNQGTLVIDTQFAEVTEDLLKVIKRFSDKPIKYVLNTHHHGDHTGGNANLSKEGALIISHDSVYSKLRQDILKDDEKGDTSALPNITTSDQLTFFFDNEEITVYHIKDAHTSGDLIVHFKRNNIIHTGDAFVNGRYPFIDTENGGTYDGYLQGLGKILKMCDKDTKIIPGHGEIANRNDIETLIQLMEYAAKQVSFHVYNGKSEEQILAMTEITAEYDRKGFGDHFITREQFLKMIYDDVSVEYLRQQRIRQDTARRIEELRREQAKENEAQNQRDKGGR